MSGPAHAGHWTPVCPLARLQPERGVAALVHGEPVALFRTHSDQLFALHNVDPFSGASVLSRGIVGDLAGTPVVASPVFKQHFALDSGRALEDPAVAVVAYPVRVRDGQVEVSEPVTADPVTAAPDGPAPDPTAGPGPLTGARVGVTADRRADDQIELLRRRGATVLHGPTMRIVPLADDADLAAVTRSLLADPPSVVVATTGQGFRGWLGVADGWAQGDALRDHLADATLLARGPKARGAIRGAGLREAWSADATEASPEVLAHLLDGGVGDLTGRRIAVQLHGDPMTSFLTALRDAGADVVEVHVYRWEPPPDLDAVDALVDAVLARALDAVTFTSAPAVDGLLHRADARGVAADLVAAFADGVTACCVGPVTAAPLDRRGVPSIAPDRFRLGAMVRRLEEQWASTAADRT